MVSPAFLLLGSMWVHSFTQASCGDKPPRDVVLAWFKETVLEGLGLEVPPVPTTSVPDGLNRGLDFGPSHRTVPRTSWMPRNNNNDHRTPNHESAEIILFPTTDFSCVENKSIPGEPTWSPFIFHFQPSSKSLETLVTLAHFWFFAGNRARANSSARLYFQSSSQRLLQAAKVPPKSSPDGWTTYDLDQSIHISLSEGPFVLQVHCPTCQCHTNQPDKTPFLHLHTKPRHPKHSPRHTRAVTIPWSPSAIDLLRRPSQEELPLVDCRKEEMEISLRELGWDNWIIEPKMLKFQYCHGNCSAPDRATTILGVEQCCAPVPNSMRSLRITTTSDGGFSYKYETLPNIIPEECTCI